MSNSTTKPCIKCGSTERYKSGDCAPCGREYDRKRRQENPDKLREYNRVYRQNNPDKERERHRKYRQANPDKLREHDRKWALANPEKINAKYHRRRANKHNNESEPYDFKAICAHYDNRCVKCGEKGKLTIDHIKPVSMGGPDIASNLQPLCGKCNSSKGTRKIDYRPDAGPLRWIQRKLFGR